MRTRLNIGFIGALAFSLSTWALLALAVEHAMSDAGRASDDARITIASVRPLDTPPRGGVVASTARWPAGAS
jgi:hypothetical protein